MWQQRQITLSAKQRGFPLITDEIKALLPELSSFRQGLVQLFLQHTSASLSINENADARVRADFASFFNRLVPENQDYYRHTLEGSDDLPSHIKSSLLGVSLLLPVYQGDFVLGTWQGIYLGEHRNNGGRRQFWVTLWGEPF